MFQSSRKQELYAPDLTPIVPAHAWEFQAQAAMTALSIVDQTWWQLRQRVKVPRISQNGNHFNTGCVRGQRRQLLNREKGFRLPHRDQ